MEYRSRVVVIRQVRCQKRPRPRAHAAEAIRARPSASGHEHGERAERAGSQQGPNEARRHSLTPAPKTIVVTLPLVPSGGPDAVSVFT